VERGLVGDCCTYIMESGGNFPNIVKGPVHGEKCVQNCALKNCNCLCFSTSAYIFFVYFMHFHTMSFRDLLLIFCIDKQFLIFINYFIIDFGIDFLQLITRKYSEIGEFLVKPDARV
jgi:hypothetical protein